MLPLSAVSHLLSQKLKQLLSELDRLFLWNPVSGIFYLSAFHLMGNPLERLHCFQPPSPTLGTAESEHWHRQFAIVFNHCLVVCDILRNRTLIVETRAHGAGL